MNLNSFYIKFFTEVRFKAVKCKCKLLKKVVLLLREQIYTFINYKPLLKSKNFIFINKLPVIINVIFNIHSLKVVFIKNFIRGIIIILRLFYIGKIIK